MMIINIIQPIKAQIGSQVIYGEIKKGESKKIKEQNFLIELEQSKPILEKVINDINDKERFKLISQLNKNDKGEYTYCSVMLYRRKKDLLNYSIEEMGDYITGACCLGYFEAINDKSIMGQGVDESFSIPLLIKRVIKVGEFYCILQVKDYSFASNKKGIFNSIKIQVEFINSYDGDKTKYIEYKKLLWEQNKLLKK